jgi:multimeric flavodoxin WrbA
LNRTNGERGFLGMPTNNIIYISGSPRKNSNTDILLKMALEITGGEFIKLSDLMVKPCASCWACQKRNNCIIDDDMTKNLTPLLLNSDGIVLGSPVYFNNVSAQLKNFIDRTWCLKKGLKNIPTSEIGQNND